MDNLEVVYSQIEQKAITMHIHSTSLSFLYSPVFIVFDVAFWKPISIDFLNVSTCPFNVTYDCAIHVPYFSAMTIYDDPALMDVIISSFSPIVKTTFLCLAFSAIVPTTLKFNSSQQRDYSTCTIKPRPASDN